MAFTATSASKVLVCKGITKSGKPCTNKTSAPNGWCGKCKGAPGSGLSSANATALKTQAVLEANDVLVEDTTDGTATPIPDQLPVGYAPGTPLLVGGGDLYDSCATVTSYRDDADPTQSWEVLHTRVTPEGESKLVEALGIGQVHKVAVPVTKTLTGRMPLDTEHQLGSDVAELAKSVNHHLKEGDQVPANRITQFVNLQAKLDKLTASPVPLTEADQAMVEHYQASAALIGERVAHLLPGASELGLEPYSVPYDAGGKIPLQAPYETTYEVTETEWKEEITENPDVALLPTGERKGSRIAPTIGEDGLAQWDGKRRSTGNGKEWVIDLGDGYQATFRPTSLVNPATDEFSALRRLTVTGPKGAGRAPELVNRLGKLHLGNRLMSDEGAEYAYLERNTYAMGLNSNPTVKKAREEAARVDDVYAELEFHGRASEGAKINDEHELAGFVRQVRLDAEHKALPAKVKLLREAVAQATGHASGDALAESPGYHPSPDRSGGWVTWRRFDVHPGSPAAKAWSAKALTHSVTGEGSGSGLADIIRNSGTVASQERRRIFGTAKAAGMSEAADMKTGGASSVFAHIQSAGGKKGNGYVSLTWEGEQLQTLVERTDWYASPNDTFGSLNSHSGHQVKNTRDAETAAGYPSGEIMFENGIDFCGREAPTAIRCHNQNKRVEILDALKDKGITTLGGRPVEDVVVIGSKY